MPRALDKYERLRRIVSQAGSAVVAFSGGADSTAGTVFSRRGEIAAEFRRLGFVYAAIDLLGYRTGSLNEVL